MERWNDVGTDSLWLLTESELDILPDGIVLMSINNQTRIKDNTLDRDTRYGVLAYGFTEKLAEEQGLKHQFLLWMMKP